MYESPITIKTEEIARNIMDKQEEYILTQVQMCVDVDKDELIKALKYDRGQYEKGYADGRASAIKRGHWVTITDEPFADRYKCSECDEEPLIVDCEFQLTPYCPFCGAKMNEVEDE